MKKIKCPVCGEKTIDIKEKAKLDYRFKSELKCSNCNSYLRNSKLSILLIFSWVLAGIFIGTRDMDLSIRIILFILVSMIYLYIDTWVIPIVKDE